MAHDTPAVTVSAPFNPFPEDDQPPEAEDERRLPNSAITVAQNHLIVGSHIDLVKKILDVEQDDSLPGSVEYKKVDAMLIQLGAAADSFRMFSRTDEEYHVTYELFRQGKMPEAETMLGGILNQMLRDEDTPKDQLREAELDGSKLPDYQVARKYLGPAGSYVRTEDDGWLLTGALLTKLPENVPANARRSRDSSTPTRQ